MVLNIETDEWTSRERSIALDVKEMFPRLSAKTSMWFELPTRGDFNFEIEKFSMT